MNATGVYLGADYNREIELVGHAFSGPMDRGIFLYKVDFSPLASMGGNDQRIFRYDDIESARENVIEFFGAVQGAGGGAT